MAIRLSPQKLPQSSSAVHGSGTCFNKIYWLDCGRDGGQFLAHSDTGQWFPKRPSDTQWDGGGPFGEVPHEDFVDVSLDASQHLTEGLHPDVVNEPINNIGQSSRELTSVDDIVPHPSKRKRKSRGLAIGIHKPKLLDLRPLIKFENSCLVHDTRNSFNTKLGIWARDQHRFPYETPHFDDFQGDVWKTLLEDVNVFFNIDYDGNLLQLVMGICRRRWNAERSKMNHLNYACFDTHEEALLRPPKYVNMQVGAIFVRMYFAILSGSKEPLILETRSGQCIEG